MGSRIARRAVTAALAAACVVGWLAVPASAAPPTNDSLAAPHDVAIGSMQVGVRGSAVDAQLGGAVFGVDTSEATTTPDEPFLGNLRERSACNDFNVRGTSTVFYRLRGRDSTEPILERAAITLDTVGTSYSTAIAVFKAPVGTPPNIAIALPNAIRCERANLAQGAAMTSFVAEVGFDYFVEVASVGGTGSMNLFVTATDLQPPTVVLNASPALGAPGTTTRFMLSTIDDGSNLPAAPLIDWKATYRPDGLPADQPSTELDVVRSPAGDEATVRWPKDALIGTGQVIVRVWDNAGNVGRASLRVRVRDRTAPTVTLATYRLIPSRNRIAATIRCNEPGTATITLRIGGRRPRPARGLKVRANARKTVVFRNVPRPAFVLLEYTCFDRVPAKNQSQTRILPDTFGF